MTDDARTRWDRRWSEEPLSEEPSAFLVTVADRYPGSGRALDVAGGTGRNALYLAERGFDVTLVDISPVAVDRVNEEAARRKLAARAVVLDLEEEDLPPGPWDVILCFHYLQRDLFPSLQEGLVTGGLLICEIATVRNLERHERPPLPYLLEEGELPSLVPSLRILDHSERWTEEDRHEARLVATR